MNRNRSEISPFVWNGLK